MSGSKILITCRLSHREQLVWGFHNFTTSLALNPWTPKSQPNLPDCLLWNRGSTNITGYIRSKYVFEDRRHKDALLQVLWEKNMNCYSESLNQCSLKVGKRSCPKEEYNLFTWHPTGFEGKRYSTTVQTRPKQCYIFRVQYLGKAMPKRLNDIFVVFIIENFLWKRNIFRTTWLINLTMRCCSNK